jgi:hypothetical protein
MNITQVSGTTELVSGAARPTREESQREYDYILAGQLTRNMLIEGFITQEEFNKIMQKNQESFSPLFARILQK